MTSVHQRKWYLPLGCLLMANLIYGNLDYQKEAAATLGQIDHHCWETSSLRLVEMNKLRVPGTVIALWEFMMFLKKSSRPKHNEVFNDLAQNFWNMYIDCVLSRSHGIGRRELQSPYNTIACGQKSPGGFINLRCKGKRQIYRRYLNRVMPD